MKRHSLFLNVFAEKYLSIWHQKNRCMEFRRLFYVMHLNWNIWRIFCYSHFGVRALASIMSWHFMSVCPICTSVVTCIGKMHEQAIVIMKSWLMQNMWNSSMCVFQNTSTFSILSLHFAHVRLFRKNCLFL